MKWFETILVVLTLATGIIWALDKWVWRRGHVRGDNLLDSDREPWVIETARSFFPVLALVLVLRSWVAEPFRIPSGSMIPSLHVGDFILVNKFAYGLRLPITNTKFVPVGEPKRGDVVVFKFPGMAPDDPEKGTDFVKRVIGLPGDRVSYHMGVLQINGAPVAYTQGQHVDQLQGEGEGMAGESTVPSELLQEQLPGRPHPVVVADESLHLGAQGDGDAVVPAGHYFVMGDNRDNSLDGRFWGMLPEANLRGKAFLVWMSWDHGVNFKRIGTRVP